MILECCCTCYFQATHFSHHATKVSQCEWLLEQDTFDRETSIISLNQDIGFLLLLIHLSIKTIML
jgi:hypothetical protein